MRRFWPLLLLMCATPAWAQIVTPCGPKIGLGGITSVPCASATAAPQTITFVNAWAGAQQSPNTTTKIDTSSGSQTQANDFLGIFVDEYNPVIHTNPSFSVAGGAGGSWNVAVPAVPPWQATGDTQAQGEFLWRVATAGDVGALFTVTGDTNGQVQACAINLRSIHTASPINIAGAGSQVATAASVNLTGSGNALFYMDGGYTFTASAPSGFIGPAACNWIGSGGVQLTGQLTYKLNVGSGATGTVTDPGASGATAAISVLVGITPGP